MKFVFTFLFFSIVVCNAQSKLFVKVDSSPYRIKIGNIVFDKNISIDTFKSMKNFQAEIYNSSTGQTIKYFFGSFYYQPKICDVSVCSFSNGYLSNSIISYLNKLRVDDIIYFDGLHTIWNNKRNYLGFQIQWIITDNK